MTAVLPRSTTWASLHLYLHWPTEAVDALLTGVIAPLLDDARDAGRLRDWFFIRYGERGPHLRIRLADADEQAVADVSEQLAAAVRDGAHLVGSQIPEGRPGWQPHGAIQRIAYEPETERYGGPLALPIAEEVFCASTRLAVDALRGRPTASQRLVMALDLTLATAVALDLDPWQTALWLRRSAIAWRWHRNTDTLAPATVQESASSAASEKSAVVAARFAALAGGGTELTRRWVEHVRSARAILEVEHDDVDSGQRRLAIWSSQLHMLLNRLGVRPDEERSLNWFITTSLLAPHGVPDYFAGGAEAADRRYLQASAFTPGRIAQQQPRDADRPAAQQRWNPEAGEPVTLPCALTPHTPIAEALANRACARGDLGGALSAADLAGVLWPAFATIDLDSGRRPYPSAGAQYVARLRLVARRVDGLAPGLYEVDSPGARLLPLSGVPTDPELAAMSMWLHDGPGGPDRVDVSTLPAMLALYVEVGALRARYGLRALRFALLEAGHLAQNLALVAAANGLSMGLVGGIYDDIAHEVFILDGVEDVLTYLLPVGRQR